MNYDKGDSGHREEPEQRESWDCGNCGISTEAKYVTVPTADTSDLRIFAAALMEKLGDETGTTIEQTLREVVGDISAARRAELEDDLVATPSAVWDEAIAIAKNLKCDRRFSSHWRSGYAQAKGEVITVLETQRARRRSRLIHYQVRTKRKVK
jgi:hypothetical protein